VADLISMDGNDPMRRRRAGEWVDAEHRREAQALKLSHSHAEKSMLNRGLDRIHSLSQNRAGIDDRYLTRIASINARKERVAEIIQARHRSPLGRLQALTRKGRAAQAEEFQRLHGRARELERRAGRNHQMHLARHDRLLRKARYEEAQFVKIYRLDNRQIRDDHRRYNIDNRQNQVHERVRDMQQERKRSLSIAHKQEFNRQANRPPSKTVQNNFMREALKRDFNYQANPLRQEFNHQVRKR
jgi:hypothetical protein